MLTSFVNYFSRF